MIIAVIFSFGLGFENNAHTFNYQTNKLQDYHRKIVLTVHLYTHMHLKPVYHQPLAGRSVKVELFLSLTIDYFRALPNF